MTSTKKKIQCKRCWWFIDEVLGEESEGITERKRVAEIEKEEGGGGGGGSGAITEAGKPT